MAENSNHLIEDLRTRIAAEYPEGMTTTDMHGVLVMLATLSAEILVKGQDASVAGFSELVALIAERKCEQPASAAGARH